MKKRIKKLYVIVRNDLEPGLQIAQACHAQHTFALRFSGLIGKWEGNLVVLQAPDEKTLEDHAYLLDEMGFSVARFREPDLDDAMTAIAVSADAGRLLSSLPLALRGAAA